MHSQAEIDQFQQKWQEHLPQTDVKGDPFYALMKFEGDENLGEIFAYPGIPLGNDYMGYVVPLFPTEEIGKACAAGVQEQAPEWRLVGVNDTFFQMILDVIKFQKINLVIGLSPESSMVCDLEKAPELAQKIREEGFTPDLLKTV